MFKVEKIILQDRRKRKLGHGGGGSLVYCVIYNNSAALLQTPRLSEDIKSFNKMFNI